MISRCTSQTMHIGHLRYGKQMRQTGPKQVNFHSAVVQVVPGAMRGESVESLRRTWPELVRPQGNTGLWWDK